MRSLLLQCSVAIAVLLPALGLRPGSPALAQPLDRSGTAALNATVISVDKGAVVVRADDGEVVTFAIDGGSFVPDGLVAGTRVTVRYQVLDGGRYRAVRVGIAAFPPEAGSTTAAPPTPEGSPTPSAEPPQAATPRSQVSGLRETALEGPALVTPAVQGHPDRPRSRALKEPTGHSESPPPNIPAPAPPRGGVAAPTTGDFVTLAATLLLAVGLLGLAFVLERR